MRVTVCIPAYRAEGFIAETVGSVLAQSLSDLRVIVAIDPPEDGAPNGTAAALAAFAADPRLTIRHNPRRLGWAENVNGLIQDITTPFFCFLPHDDIWSPRYLETLMAALDTHPEAVIAYGDILRFGATPPTRKAVTLSPGADRTTALLQFLRQGTDAQMWRGLTRSSVLARVPGFPTDGHKGFVVEAEYALALLGAGAACHVPRTLYFKRIYPHDVISASRERMLLPAGDRRAGWEEHDRRMRALLSDALTDMAAAPVDRWLCRLALEAALLKRFQQFVGPELGPDEETRRHAALSACGPQPTGDLAGIAADLYLLGAEHRAATGDPVGAEADRRRAWETADTFASVLVHARSLHREGRSLEALERATEALRLAHLDDAQAASQLIEAIYRHLGWARAQPAATPRGADPCPDISVVVCAYNMARELPRTLQTLSRDYQQGLEGLRHEVIVLDNGSRPALRQEDLSAILPEARLFRPDQIRISPVAAINQALALARAPLIGLCIDGARMASPNLLRLTHEAWRRDPDRLIGTLAFHLGPDVQMVTVPQGYDAATEDRLLASVPWQEDGYRLFDISVLAGSSRAGWNGPIAESNALFLDRRIWDRLGGMDERFQSAGGGFCNLDLWDRAMGLCGAEPWILLGEGTFHQVHGGAATNGTQDDRRVMAEEYIRLHGRPFQTPTYRPRFLGSLDHVPARLR